MPTKEPHRPIAELIPATVCIAGLPWHIVLDRGHLVADDGETSCCIVDFNTNTIHIQDAIERRHLPMLTACAITTIINAAKGT